uniref:Uncharacterized protein n=1 Tax=Cacopsylla melanoneura TaxID=428564 RepID=A0A8D9AY81_9HEMI
MLLSVYYVIFLIKIFGFQHIYCSPLLTRRGFWSSSTDEATASPPTPPTTSRTTRTPITTTTIKPDPALTPPPQIAKYVGLEGLYNQFNDVNKNTMRNTVGTTFTIGTNTAAFGTNIANEWAKLTRSVMNSYMDSQSRFLDSLINANQAIEASSKQILNGTHQAIKNTLDHETHNWDLMTDMYTTGAKNAFNSEGGGSSSINIKTTIG